jgi:UDP-glucuronate decarboxylase
MDPANWGRIFYLYGPHEYPQRLIPSVIQGLVQKERVSCSHGDHVRDFLHVQDVADAFVTLLESDVQGVVNIGSGVGVRIKEVINTIAEQVGGSDLVQFSALAAPKNDPPSLIANTARLRKEVGWGPRFSLEEGIRDTIAWWKDKASHLR